jgi:hypothetical protein
VNDDDIVKIKQAVARTLASLKEESYIGSPLTQERLEAAASKAMGFPVHFPDYDGKTGKVAKMVFVPPIKRNYIDVIIVLDSEGEE